MTTVQIIGIAVAGAALLLLIIALIVTRRRGDDAGEARAGGSFLDEAPQDTFAGLGKAEHPVEDITLDPAMERARAAEAARRAAEAAQRDADEPGAGPGGSEPGLGQEPPQPGGLGLDWGPDLSVRELQPEPPAPPAWGAEDEDEVTRELRPDDEITGVIRPAAGAASPSPDAPPASEGESDDQAAVPKPTRPAEGGPAASSGAPPESGAGSRLVPLSDIIVTTSTKMVDLQDPEVRRMLTDLVTFEIDQAADFRRQGQGVDAILQLTEAEKVARALGMTESAHRIRAMMKDIRRSE